MKSIYIGGSLRNPKIVEVANAIQEQVGIEAFADWFAVGPEADDYWKKYNEARKRSYPQALAAYDAMNTFKFDKVHLDRTDGMVLVMPAGKSAHLELGYTVGRGKPAYILFEGEPERWDLMYNFATEIFFSLDALIGELKIQTQEFDCQIVEAQIQMGKIERDILREQLRKLGE